MITKFSARVRLLYSPNDKTRSSRRRTRKYPTRIIQRPTPKYLYLVTNLKSSTSAAAAAHRSQTSIIAEYAYKFYI